MIQFSCYKTPTGSLESQKKTKTKNLIFFFFFFHSVSSEILRRGALFELVHSYLGERSAFASDGHWMTCQRLASEGHSFSLSFQALFTTKPRTLLNNRKNVIWLLFKARRYHSLNRTGGLEGYKGAHSKQCLLSKCTARTHWSPKKWCNPW